MADDSSGVQRKPSKDAEDVIPTYSVLIEKNNKNKYGIAYRVVEGVGVVITGIIPNSSVDEWNMQCDPGNTVCTSDTIISANQQQFPRAIVDELLHSVKLLLHVQKSGPRWHITGEGAKYKESDDPNLRPGVAGASVSQEQLLAPAASGQASEQGNAPAHPLQPGGVVLLFAAVFVPNVTLLALFSDVGRGIPTFTSLCESNANMQGNAIIFLGSMVAVGLIVYDWRQWRSHFKKVFYPVILTYFICFGFILKARFYPQTPLVIILFHIPVFLGLLRGKVLKDVSRRSFYVGVTASVFSCSVFMLSIWLVWMNVGAWDGTHRWGDATKEQLVMDSEEIYTKWQVKINDRYRPLNYFWDCAETHKQDYDYLHINTFKYMDANFTRSDHLITSSENEERGGACARIKTIWFLVYSTPLFCTFVDLIIAVFCLFNGVLLNVADTSELERVLKHFILMICFLVFTMYVASSIAGASMRLTGVIIAFCASGMVALCVWLYMEIGGKAITSQVRNSRLMKSLIALATSDWMRACVLIAANVLIPASLCINRLNQLMRKKRGLTPRDDPVYTPAVNTILLAVQNWHWASILIKSNWLVILYWTMSVGVAKITYVFLSWFNEMLLDVPFVSVIVIFFVIGFTMFMLPPVPGIPVYICSGIVLSARARDIPEAGKFWGGMCIAVFESLVLKICAVCGQYMIGFFMGKSVKVQQLVAVDKVFTRGIEKILATRGLNLPKVSVLVGGPDWPTSVLCGILRLNLFQICLGTLPVVFVSAPCVVAGAFMSNPGKDPDKDERRLRLLSSSSGDSFTTPLPKTKEDLPWDTLSTTALGVSMAMQLAGMVLALYYIQKVVHLDGEELAKPRPEHEAVAALTRQEADYVQEYDNVLKWSSLPVARKRLIMSANISMLLSIFMFVMMDEVCFLEFQVSNRISDPPEQGGLDKNPLNLVMPMGWFALVNFFVACSLHFAFLRWATKETRRRYALLSEHRPPRASKAELMGMDTKSLQGIEDEDQKQE